MLPDTAHHLSGMLPVAGVDVDEISLLLENPVAKLPGLVVVHTAQQDHPLRLHRVRYAVRLCQDMQFLLRFDEFRPVLALDAESGGIPRVSPDILLHEVLPYEVFLFDHVAVADDDPGGMLRSVAQAVQMRNDIAAGPAGAQYHDFDRGRFRISHPDSSIGGAGAPLRGMCGTAEPAAAPMRGG